MHFWAVAHRTFQPAFTDPYAAVESGIDSDSDGAGDVMEIVAGTGVDNPADLPRLSIAASNGVAIGTDGKTDRSYVLEISTNLSTEGWSATGSVFHLSSDQSVEWNLPADEAEGFFRTHIHDQGRLIQQSYYAGQNLDRTAEGQSPSWSPWPWNPIQGGDASGKASEVLEVGAAEFGGGVFTRTVPFSGT